MILWHKKKARSFERAMRSEVTALLNREQRIVLKALNDMRECGEPFSAVDLYNRTRLFDREKMVKLCNILKELGYFDLLDINMNNEICMIKLSYRGMTYKAEIYAGIRKYIAEKWIDFVALLVSISALVISLVALLQKPQG